MSYNLFSPAFHWFHIGNLQTYLSLIWYVSRIKLTSKTSKKWHFWQNIWSQMYLVSVDNSQTCLSWFPLERYIEKDILAFITPSFLRRILRGDKWMTSLTFFEILDPPHPPLKKVTQKSLILKPRKSDIKSTPSNSQ